MRKWLPLLLVLPLKTIAQQTQTGMLYNAAYHEPYHKPAPFSFIKDIPADIKGYVKKTFSRTGIKQTGIVAASTIALLFADQQITDNLQSFFKRNNIAGTESFSPVITVKIGGKKTNIGKMPHNINSAFYNLGQGSLTVFSAAGLFVYGKIKHDNRALQTASQLSEAFIALGAGTQMMKYISGRQTPAAATQKGGAWRPFPSLKHFQKNKPGYDAFPSGHMATLVSTVTILAENYPEKKWIKPVGFAIAGLCGLSMLNNGVHWAGDYPLGVALGYGFGKFIAKKKRLPVTP